MVGQSISSFQLSRQLKNHEKAAKNPNLFPETDKVLTTKNLNSILLELSLNLLTKFAIWTEELT